MYTNKTIDLVIRLATISDDFPGYENDFVNMIRKVVGPEPVPMVVQPTDPTVSEMLTLKSIGKVEAIKAYRARVQCGLKEAKDTIEAGGHAIGFLVLDEHGYLTTEKELKSRAFHCKDHSANDSGVGPNPIPNPDFKY